MLTIAPQKAFLVDIKLNNPSDTDQHWVRSVIKNSISGVILASLDLDDQGNRYFSKQWITPADTTGTGLQISIDTTVYDDSGYSSESLVYGTLHETYIVREMPSPRMGFAGGVGGTSGIRQDFTDYVKIEKLIRQILAEQEKLEIPAYPEQKEVDLTPILEAIQASPRPLDHTNELAELKDKLTQLEAILKEQKPNQMGLIEGLFKRFKPEQPDLNGTVSKLTEQYDEKLNVLKESIDELIETVKVKEPELPTEKDIEVKEKKKETKAKIARVLGVKEVEEESPHSAIIKKLLTT